MSGSYYGAGNIRGSGGYSQEMTGGIVPGGASQYSTMGMGVKGTTDQNTANLKGKLMSLDEQLSILKEECAHHKKEVSILRSEKDTIESMLTQKTQEANQTLSNELFRVEEEMKRHFSKQKLENTQLQQHITTLKGEKTALSQQILGMQKRIAELELQIGAEDM